MPCPAVLPPWVSLLIPLNVGKTYTFRARVAEKPPPEDVNEEIARQWGEVFRDRQAWDLEQFPREFSKPLGWIARRRIDSADPELQRALEQTSWIEPGTATAEIVFFPVGVGVLVLRARLHCDTAEGLAEHRSPEKRHRFRKDFAPLLNRGAEAYRGELGTAAKKPEEERTVYELPAVHVGQPVPIREARYSFPLVFTSQDDYEKLRALDVQEAGRSIAEHTYSDGRHSARIHVGWAEAYATGESEDLRQAIETDFVIALASWYALALMNRLVSLYLLEVFTDLSAKRPRIRKKQSRIIRLTYMDAANASHPVRWTTRHRDLLLLECIHATWSSGRWWENVEERTGLLALHHDQLEDEESERRNSWLAFFGIAIACLTLASATADVLHLYFEDHLYSVATSLGIPVVVGFVLWRVWRRFRPAE